MNTSPTDFPKAYMRLRTLLDAVEVNTMRYCLDGADADECISRMLEVETELMNMIGLVGGEGPCDIGYFNCGGVCVPYSCFEQYLSSSEASMEYSAE